MNQSNYVHLAPAEASALIQGELERARECLDRGRREPALDGYVRALGLGLQLGPAATELVLTAVLDAARDLASRLDAQGLSALGPSLVDLVDRVVDTGVLPATPVMQAWATFAHDLCGLLGQVGLALAIPSRHRIGMLENARARAVALDESTNELFAVAEWIDALLLQTS
jgi:hypothetical protein